jgi:hypothetical protein
MRETTEYKNLRPPRAAIILAFVSTKAFFVSAHILKSRSSRGSREKGEDKKMIRQNVIGAGAGREVLRQRLQLLFAYRLTLLDKLQS